MSDYVCECPVAGYCQRHKIHKTQRDVELCKGSNCTPKQSAKYRVLWDERSQTPTTKTATINAVKTDNATPRFEPVPRDEWPLAAKSIAALATDQDAGVGDTIKRLLGSTGRIYQALFKSLTGKNCTGCGFRQNKWNQLYPYQ